MKKRRKEWIAEVPKNCDICGREIVSVFYDAPARMGAWACMCGKCFKSVGCTNPEITGGRRYVKRGLRWVRED